MDQYLNIKLDDITVVEEVKYPHLVGLGSGFLRILAVKSEAEMGSVRWTQEKLCISLLADREAQICGGCLTLVGHMLIV